MKILKYGFIYQKIPINLKGFHVLVAIDDVIYEINEDLPFILTINERDGVGKVVKSCFIDELLKSFSNEIITNKITNGSFESRLTSKISYL